MQKTFPQNEIRSPKPVTWNIGIGFSFPFLRNNSNSPSEKKSTSDSHISQRAENLTTTNFVGDRRSPEKFASPSAVQKRLLTLRSKCSSANTSPFIDTMSIASSISHDDIRYDENEKKSDLQSIIFNEDIQILEEVQKTDTKTFVPNIQYGKVLEIISGTEILVAARIYNGYTKVLGPSLYNFRIRLRNVPYFGIYEECAKNELSALILNKIVLIKNGVFSADGFIISDIYNVNIHYLKQNLQNANKIMMSDNEYLNINDTMKSYSKFIISEH
jgi:hypothetical protein